MSDSSSRAAIFRAFSNVYSALRRRGKALIRVKGICRFMRFLFMLVFMNGGLDRANVYDGYCVFWVFFNNLRLKIQLGLKYRRTKYLTEFDRDVNIKNFREILHFTL